MAARDRLGGLAPETFAAVMVLQAAFDRVIVETVGVGQSETDVRTVADATVFVVQPASGDALQFLKAGLMEIPDVFVVNKADLGPPARRAVADLRGTLPSLGRAEAPVLAVSSTRGDGLDDLCAALEAHRVSCAATLELDRDRRTREHAVDRFEADYGRVAVRTLGGKRALSAALDTLPPGTPPSELRRRLLDARRSKS